jgi:Peptidase family S41
MRQRPASWKASAAYRLGMYWQGAGDFERAESAYQAVLSEIDGHAPTLFNLSVTQIRLGQPQRALRSMNTLADVAGGGIPKEGQESQWRTWSPVGCSIAYNRALAWHYDEDNDRAGAWSLSLARRVLTPHGGSHGWETSNRDERRKLERLAWSALMLHASITVDKLGRPLPGELHSGALLPHAKLERALDDELGGFDERLDDTARERELRERLVSRLAEPSAPMHLEWYVRLQAGEDVRTRYNLACYVARLAKAADAETARRLRQRGIDHATFAMRDHRLAAWAEQDPALEPLKRHDQWSKLVVAAATEAAPSETAGTGTPKPVEPAEKGQKAEKPEPARMDRRALIGQVSVLLEEVHPSPLPSMGLRSERLFARVESLSDAAFQRELTGLVASLHDPMTVYAHRDATTAALPLILERCLDGDDTRCVVAKVGEEYKADLPPGTEVTHWNGVPIESALQAHTGLIGAATADARSARAIASLTHWPLHLLGPPGTDVVQLRCRRGATEDEVRLRWRRTEHPHGDGALRSVDLLSDMIRRSRADHLPRTTSSAAGPTEFRVDPSGPAYGHLRLPSFDVEDADAFVDDVMHAVSRVPESGLVIDLRGNSGGRIDAAERLLQLFTPRDIEPQRLQARTTDLMGRVAQASEALELWRRPIEAAARAGTPLTEPFELAPGHTASCNHVGQIYHGPVALVVDALTGGAADFFVAGFVDHAIGSITSVDDPSGNAPRPAEAWSHAHLRELVPGHPLEPLPQDVLLHVPVRRAARRGWQGVEPHHHRRTRADVIEGDRDLLEEVVGRLAAMSVRVLRPTLRLRSRRHIEGEVTTKGLSALQIVVDREERKSWKSLEDGTRDVTIAVTGRGPHVVELRGLGPDGNLLARRRVTLGP